MYRNPVRGSPIATEQDKPPPCIRQDRPDPNRLRAEPTLPPVQALVRAGEDVIGRFFVVGHDDNGTRISELVEACVLMNFLPCEPGVATQERVAVRVTDESLPDVSDCPR